MKMQRIDYPDFKETCFYEEMENGLKVYVFHKPDFKSSYAAFGTPYGALDIHQKYHGKHYDFHPGIAHFLEHKVFEDEDGDVLSKFAELGASVNAFTSYTETVYHFSLTGEENFREALEMLLDFVQKLNISHDSIEAEKPIIIQEVSMYEQQANTRLLNETYKSLFKNYPLINDIGGDVKSVNEISKDELETCYNINYHPSNMIVSIVSFMDPEYIISIIRDNQSKKKFLKDETATNDNHPEAECVNREYFEFNMDVSTTKNVYAIKLNLGKLTKDDSLLYENAIRSYLQLCFSNLNPEYQKWIDQKLITDYFSYEVEINEDVAYILFCSEDNTAEELKTFINREMARFEVKEDALKQLKHRYIGNFFDEFSDLESFNITFIRDMLDEINPFDAYCRYLELDTKTIENIVKSLDFSHFSLISLKSA